jgi:hypothetical protein
MHIEQSRRAMLMQAIKYMELVLIELDYAVADCFYRKTGSQNPLERVRLEALLQKIRAAKVAAQYALDNMETAYLSQAA